MKLEDAKRELEGDPIESLLATFDEYYEGQSPPTTREEIIQKILRAMQHDGHIEPTTIKLSDIARQLNINPKVARDKMRRAHSKGMAPPSSKPTGWVFNSTDRPAIEAIIKRKDHGSEL